MQFLYTKQHIQNNHQQHSAHHWIKVNISNGSYLPTITEGIEIHETDVLIVAQFYSDALSVVKLMHLK